MKHNVVRTVELSLLVMILLACVGAVSTVELKPTFKATPFPAASDIRNRFLEYLNSPINP